MEVFPAESAPVRRMTAGVCRLLGIAFMAAVLADCGAAGSAGGAQPDAWAPPRLDPPLGCSRVSEGEDLQARLDAAPAGAVLCLAPGSYRGPFRIDRTLHVWGPLDAVLLSNGAGTTVRISGAGASLRGLTVDGSGGRFDTTDAAVLVSGNGVHVEGVHVRNAVFGILVEKAREVVLRGNDVLGVGGEAYGLRGDGIRLWETRDSVVEANRVRQARDMVVWYSSGNVVRDNLVTTSRYGTHFMYSHDNHVEGNRYFANIVGVFIMYSRNITFSHNVIAGSLGAAGVGIGVKESGNLTVTDNVLVRNTTGAYLETTPLQQTDHNLFARNVFRLGSTGVVFHSSPARNTFRDNDFRDNSAQVAVEGGGDASGVSWETNFFDDYAGYDMDGDGFGDVAYELRSLTADIVRHYPALSFFRGAPALGLVELVGKALPLLRPTTILVDSKPRMASVEVNSAN